MSLNLQFTILNVSLKPSSDKNTDINPISA